MVLRFCHTVVSVFKMAKVTDSRPTNGLSDY